MEKCIRKNIIGGMYVFRNFCILNWWDWDIVIIFDSWSLRCRECCVEHFVYVSYYDMSINLWRGFLQEFKSYLKYPCKISSSLTLISSGTHFAGNILYDLNLMYGPELNNNCVSISDVWTQILISEYKSVLYSGKLNLNTPNESI